MTRRRLGWATVLLVALAITGVGLAGALSYARDYNLHRGFTTLVRFRRAGAGRLEQIHFYSHALHREADYLVYLPPHYSRHRRYPAYYLLHGSPGQPRVFVDIANMDIRLDNQMSVGRSVPMILVYPDGRINGSTFSDSEWANTPSGNYASYVIDVVRNVDQRFAAIPRRQDRVIAGFSAGAFGAMNIALHHLRDFANVQSWSGYFQETPTAVFAHASRALLAANSPIDYITRIHAELKRDPLRAYLFVGRDDSSARQQGPMLRALRAAGVAVRAAEYPGGHDWAVWYPRLNQMLDMASADVLHPPTYQRPSGPVGRRDLTPGPSAAAPGPSDHRARAMPATDAGRTGHHHRRRRSELSLIVSLLLALVSAALINIGFVLQHRGHERDQDSGSGVLAVIRQPAWLIGQLIGWIGFGGQILAVALAPLTLVQAFSAGSLALSVPVAAAAFGHRVERRQIIAIVLIAVSLATLPIGFGGTHGHLHPGLLIGAGLMVIALAGWLLKRGGSLVCAVVAGVFYGLGDGAIKAESLDLRFHHSGVFTGWTLLAALATLGGFIAFQTALQRGDAVRPLSLMNAMTALTAIVLGLTTFGERLGAGPATLLLHVVAIGVVLASAAVLSEIGTESAAPGPVTEGQHRPPVPGLTQAGWWVSLRTAGGAVGVLVVLLTSCVSMLGWIYVLRQLNLFSIGLPVGDSLPLLQLAGFDGQSLARVLIAAALTGAVAGVALARTERRTRLMVVGTASLLILLLDSDISYALAHNLRLGQVLLARSPGFGPWLEAFVLTAASLIPVQVRAIRTAAAPPRFDRRVLIPALSALLAIGVVVALVVPSGRADQPRAHGASWQQTQVRAHQRPSSSSASGGRAPSPVAVAEPRPATATATATATVLNTVLDQARVRFGAPAATAASAVCGHPVWSGASGVIDLHSHRRATSRSLFVLNSAAKTVVATMIMQQVAAHRLSLSTRLSRFYPGLPDARRISVRMLLNMTSGLPDYLGRRRVKWEIAHHPMHRWTIDQILTGLGSGLGQPAFAPGRRFQYSDTNYIVLGGILQLVTHRSVEQVFRQQIALPLRIPSATWLRTPAAERAMAHPYKLDRDGRLISRWIPGYGPSSAVWGLPFTDGGLAATAVDLARFASALFDGRLVTPGALAQMTKLGGGDYGLGLRGKFYDRQFWLGHAGAFQGFEAEDWTQPARHLTIAVTTNVQARGGLISNSIWEALVRASSRLGAPAGTSCAS